MVEQLNIKLGNMATMQHDGCLYETCSCLCSNTLATMGSWLPPLRFTLDNPLIIPWNFSQKSSFQEMSWLPEDKTTWLTWFPANQTADKGTQGSHISCHNMTHLAPFTSLWCHWLAFWFWHWMEKSDINKEDLYDLCQRHWTWNWVVIHIVSLPAFFFLL